MLFVEMLQLDSSAWNSMDKEMQIPYYLDLFDEEFVHEDVVKACSVSPETL